MEGPVAIYAIVILSTIATAATSTQQITNPYGPGDVVLTGPSTLVLGKNYKFTCEATCNPPCSITWGNDRTPGNQTFYLEPARIEDGEVLTCQAQNPVTGVKKATFKVIRLIDPANPISLKAHSYLPPVLGYPYALKCIVSPNASSVVWLKNNQFLNFRPDSSIIQMEHDTLLFFNPLRMFDNGVYQCGQFVRYRMLTTERLTIRVNYGPQQYSTEVLGQSRLAAGGTVELRCKADCYPPCNYTWYLGKKLFWHGSGVKIMFANLTDSGNVTCKADNDVTGISVNTSTYLTVTDTVSQVQPGSNNPPLANHVFSLYCTTQTNASSIHWFRSGQPVQIDDRVRLSDYGSNLTFDTLLPTDSGFYQCSPLTIVMGHGYELNVIYGPENVTIMGPSVLFLGQSYNFYCKAPSYPRSTYIWSLNGKEVALDAEYQLKYVTSSDNGTLACIAYNVRTGLTCINSIQLIIHGGAGLAQFSKVALMSGLILQLLIHSLL